MKTLGTLCLLGVAVLGLAAGGVRLLAGSASGWPAPEPSVRSRFIGVWKLVSCERKSSSGKVSYPYGENPVGRITYDKAGRMSAQLMRPGPRPASGTTLRSASPDELRDVLGFFAYFGTFDIDEPARTVIHHVQAGLAPSLVGTDLKRTYEFSDNRLILTARTEDAVTRVVWEREPD